jgi:superfamily II DNA helicase RecQ
MEKPVRFITGFRRGNLAIEVVELPVPERAGAICGLLATGERRPAIVYATSRKMAEQLAEELARRIPAAAYHAGLDPATRERVQTSFQSGELEVVVATIAFGMGIDKANVRTVIHAGLPATLEGYYQEIGRAGRDGAQSRPMRQSRTSPGDIGIFQGVIVQPCPETGSHRTFTLCAARFWRGGLAKRLVTMILLTSCAVTERILGVDLTNGIPLSRSSKAGRTQPANCQAV